MHKLKVFSRAPKVDYQRFEGEEDPRRAQLRFHLQRLGRDVHTIAEAERRTIVALSAAKASSPDAEVGSLCSAAITYLEDLRRLGGAKFDSQYVTAKLPATLAGLMAATGATNDASRGKLDVPVLRLEVDTLRELCEVSSLTRRMALVVSLRIVCAESDLERLEKARQLSKLWGVRSLTFHDSVTENARQAAAVAVAAAAAGSAGAAPGTLPAATSCAVTAPTPATGVPAADAPASTSTNAASPADAAPASTSTGAATADAAATSSPVGAPSPADAATSSASSADAAAAPAAIDVGYFTAFSLPGPPSPLAGHHLDLIAADLEARARRGTDPEAAGLIAGLKRQFGGFQTLRQLLWLALCLPGWHAQMMHMLPRVLGCQELEAARRAQPLVFARAVERRPEVAASPTAQAYQDGMIVAGNAVRAMGNAFAFLTDGTAAVTADPEKYSGFILPFTIEMRQRLYLQFGLSEVLGQDPAMTTEMHRIEATMRSHAAAMSLREQLQLSMAHMSAVVIGARDQLLTAMTGRAALPAPAAQQGDSQAEATGRPEAEAAAAVAPATSPAAQQATDGAEPTAAEADAPAESGAEVEASEAGEAAAAAPAAHNSATEEAAAGSKAVGETAAAAAAVPDGFTTCANPLYGCGGAGTPQPPHGHKRTQDVVTKKEKEQQAAN